MRSTVFFLLFCFFFTAAAGTLDKIQVKSKLDPGEPSVWQGEQDPAPIIMALPNTNSAGGSNQPRFFQIRGIGETSQFEHAQVNPVGIFYEGIDLSEEASVLPLLGRESVVLNYGPQTMEWGGKAFGGSLEATSCLERSCAPYRAQFSLGNFGSQNLTGGPLVKGERLEALVAGGLNRSEGFYKNLYLDKHTSRVDEQEFVLGLAYGLSRVRLRQHHLWLNHRNGYDVWSTEPGFHTISDHPGRDHHQTHGHSLSYTLPAGEYSFNGLTSFTFTRQEESYDEDWGNDVFWNQVPGWTQDYDYAAAFERNRQKFHQKLSVQKGGTEAGLHFYRYNEEQVIQSFKDESLRRESRPLFKSQHLRAFVRKQWAHGAWNFTSALSAEQQWIGLEGLGPPARQTAGPQWAAQLQAEKIWTETFRQKLLFSRGFRGAGYNTSENLPRDQLHFEPEQLNMLQFSNTFDGTTAQMTHRLFYQWQEHQQTRSSLQIDPMDPNTFTYFTGNGGSSRSFGYEAFLVQRLKKWSFHESLGLMQSRFRHRELAQAPRWTYNLLLAYSPYPWDFFARLNGRAAYFHADDHEYKSKPYHLVDAGVSYFIHHWEVRLFSKNVFDQRYPVRAYRFANEPPEWEEKYYVQWGAPRTYGVQLVYEY